MADTDTPIRLDRWALHTNPYLAPEMRSIGQCYLSGFVVKHPKFPAGHRIETSGIAAVKGRVITTASGSCYRLGRAHPDYARFCREHGFVCTGANPIRALSTPTPPAAPGEE